MGIKKGGNRFMFSLQLNEKAKPQLSESLLNLGTRPFSRPAMTTLSLSQRWDGCVLVEGLGV